MKDAWMGEKPRGRLSPWMFVALLSLWGWGALRPAASGAEHGPLYRVKADPEWTFGVSGVYPYSSPYDYTPAFFFELNGSLLFSGYDRTHGWELWRSDGTAERTFMFKDFNPGPTSTFVKKGIRYNGSLLLLVNQCSALLKTDGTTSGSVVLKTFSSATQPTFDNGEMAEYRGRVYFALQDSQGAKLWRTDGTTAGTEVVKMLYPSNYIEANYFEFDGYLYIDNGSDLYRTDGTAAGTQWVCTRPGSDLTNINGSLFYFSPGTFTSQSNKLCKSAQPTSAPLALKDCFYGKHSGFYRLNPADSVVYFAADDGLHGMELWRSDGTRKGTTIVLDIQAGYVGSRPENLTVIGGELFFSVEKGGGHGYALWKSDGTAEGTQLVREFHPTPAGFYKPCFGNLLNVDGTLYFAADDGGNLKYLWRSDGTGAGTVRVPNAEGIGGDYPTRLVVCGDHLFLNANVSKGRGGLWAVGLALPSAVRHWVDYK